MSTSTADLPQEILITLQNGQPANLLYSVDDAIVYTTLNSVPATVQKFPLTRLLNAQLSSHPSYSSHEFTLSVLPPNKHQVLTIRGAVKAENVKGATEWCKIVMENAYKDVKPFRRLKLIINPISGTSKAKRNFESIVKPILENAQCSIDLTYTERINHAKELAHDLLLEDFDVLVCISGDGLLHEVINGLASRADALHALRTLPLAIVPSGSANAMSTNLLGPTRALKIEEATLNVIKGSPLPMDVLSITQGSNRFYSFMTQAYGLMADVDIGTDHLRWMGSLRFTLAFIKGVLQQWTYRCEIYMHTIEPDKEKIKSAVFQPFSMPNQVPLSTDVNAAMPELKYGTVNDTLALSEPQWEKFEGNVTTFYAGKQPYVANDVLTFPAAKPDGLIDLIILPEKVGKLKLLGMMDGADTGQCFHKEYYQYTKVDCYRLIPLGKVGDPTEGKPTGWLAMDGEVMDYAPFQVECHQGIGRLLGETEWYLPPNWKS